MHEGKNTRLLPPKGDCDKVKQLPGMETKTTPNKKG